MTRAGTGTRTGARVTRAGAGVTQAGAVALAACPVPVPGLSGAPRDLLEEARSGRSGTRVRLTRDVVQGQEA